MKKSLVVLLIALAIVALFVGCKDPEVTYEVGGKGPAGGYIFYDCDAYNTEDGGAGKDGLKSSECGWRFLEAAPKGLGKYQWGTSSATSSYGTEAGIGKGKSNMVKFKYYGIGNFPAAEACSKYNAGGYSDWFLPSIDEMKEMYKHQVKIGVWDGNSGVQVWSSTESDSTISYPYQNPNSGAIKEAFGYSENQQYELRTCSLAVWPIRSF